MQFGAITGYVDLAQIILYMFWLFFAGLIYYLIRENHREGYPMETDARGQAPLGWPVPAPKVFKMEHGSVSVPDVNKREPKFSATVMAGGPGSPLQPAGDAMLAAVGAGSYAMRADVPDMMTDGHVKIVPLRVAKGYGVASNDPDPRGMTVTAGDGKAAGTVRDVWVDKAEMTFRYLEVETLAAAGAASKRVMLPVPFARIRRSGVEVNSIFAKHFANVPGLKNPDQITFLEEERIVAYFGGGTQYAEPSRGEPIL